MIIPVFTRYNNRDRLSSERVPEMGSTKKGTAETTCLEDGLRVLARWIARELLAKGESGSESKKENSDVIGK